MKTPFQDILNLIADMPEADTDMAAKARAHFSAPALTHSAGRLADLGAWLAAWTAKMPAPLNKPLVSIFIASEGVSARLVSAAPAALNRRLMDQLANGSAPVAQSCARFEIGLRVLDLAVDVPTPDICVLPAFSARDCAGTIAFGMEAVAAGGDVLCLAGMGVGSEVSALAVLMGVLGIDEAEDDSASCTLARTAVAHHGLSSLPALDVLALVGGREVAAILGALIAARYQRIPVVLDGLAALAAASCLHAIDRNAIAHCIIADTPPYALAPQVLARLGLKPVFDLGLQEAMGAALSIGVLRAAAHLMVEPA